MSKHKDNAPIRIWIRWHDDDTECTYHPAEMTWLKKQVGQGDIEYMLADEYHALQMVHGNLEKELAALRERVGELERDSIMLDWLTKNGHLPHDVYAMALQYVTETPE